MRTCVADGWRFAAALGRGLGGHGSRVGTRRWQDRQAASLVAYAARHVPYYRQLFAVHGIDSASIRTVDDLSRIPVTTKATLKALPLVDRVSDEFDAESLIRHATSGSSGIPFQIRRTWFDERRLNVFWTRQIMRQGVRPWHRIATLAGARAGQSGDRAFIQKTLAGAGLFRNVKLSSLQPADEALAALARVQPDHLMGFAWALLRVGDAYVASGRRGFRPVGIHTFGEVLTPSMRQRLHEAFQCPVLDLYGSYELGMAAFECRTQPY